MFEMCSVVFGCPSAADTTAALADNIPMAHTCKSTICGWFSSLYVGDRL